MKKLFLILIFATGFAGASAQCTCPNMGPELVVNGDFSAGNTGFTSAYTYSSFAWPGFYGITTNANTNNSNWCAGGDNTTGNGNFFWVDASNTTPNVLIWQENITVTPNTNYVFSCWVNTLDPQGPGTLQFSVNNILIGTPFTAPSTLCTWAQFCFNWNSGTSTTASIGISNQSTFFAGNDMGIDDISFRGCQTTNCNVTATISPNTSICHGNSAQLNASGGTSYLWSPSGSLSSGTISNPVATPTVTTIYTVIVSDQTCSDTAFVTVNVNPVPIAIVNINTSICSGSSTQLTATGGNSYSWIPATGLNNPNISNPVAAPSMTTIYSVIVSNGQCSDTATITVTVVATPVAVSCPDQTICVGDNAQLSASGGITYTWSPSTGLNNSTIANPIASPSATTVYTLTASNGLCSSTSTVTVFVSPPPVAIINASATSGTAPLVVDFTSNSVNATSSLFTLMNDNSTYSNNFTYTFNEPGVYTITLVVVNLIGCTDSISITIEVKPVSSIYVPNTFTPNGDGINDVFKAETDGIEEFEAYIFDRWGNLIFTWTDKEGGWNGNYKGELVQEDVYVWKIKAIGVDGKYYQPIGHVSVIR